MISINIQTFATDLLNTVDYVINGFVQSGYEHLVQSNQADITLLMTFYIAWIGYKFMTSTLEMDVNTLARHLGLLIIVYALISDWQLFYLFFYNLFTNEPALICQTMIDANGNVNLGGETTAAALDSVFNQGMNAASQLFLQFNMHNWSPLFDAIVVFIATLANCLFALALLVYAKMATALALFLGPIFIIMMLWNTTREFFNKWLQKLFNYALIPILTCGILMLTLSIANVTLPGLVQNANSGTPTFTGIIPFVGISFVSVLLYFQILPTSAALSGGMALAGLSLALPLVKQAMKASGMGKVASATSQGLASAQSKVQEMIKQRQMNQATAARSSKLK